MQYIFIYKIEVE